MLLFNIAFQSQLKKLNPLAQTCAEHTNEQAVELGYRDIFDFLISRHAQGRREIFLTMMQDDIPDPEVQKFVKDGLAQVYAGAKDWEEYVEVMASGSKPPAPSSAPQT